MHFILLIQYGLSTGELEILTTCFLPSAFNECLIIPNRPHLCKTCRQWESPPKSSGVVFLWQKKFISYLSRFLVKVYSAEVRKWFLQEWEKLQFSVLQKFHFKTKISEARKMPYGKTSIYNYVLLTIRTENLQKKCFARLLKNRWNANRDERHNGTRGCQRTRWSCYLRCIKQTCILIDRDRNKFKNKTFTETDQFGVRHDLQT